MPGEVIIVNAVVNRSGHGAASSKIIFKMVIKCHRFCGFILLIFMRADCTGGGMFVLVCVCVCVCVGG